MVRLDRTFSDYIFTGDRSAICTSSMRFKHSEPHRTLSNCILTELARYIEFFYTSSGWFEPHRTFSNYILEHSEPPRTFSNYILTEIAQKTFRVVRLDRTFSDYIFTGDRSTSSLRFKHIEPHRTFSNYILTERGRFIDFFYRSSALFDWTEPSLTTALHGIEVLYVLYSSLRFKHIEPHRTFSNYILTERGRFIDFFYRSSVLFNWTEPSLTTALQGIEVLYVLVRRGSSTANLIEPSASKVEK